MHSLKKRNLKFRLPHLIFVHTLYCGNQKANSLS
ncbi:unnamed protein product [Chironomus riparius]|uniref:Uncharacterized protein n=1 Tax=Chironomus riparius TaxID=315576 RepID=A0A9N9RND2_9DIPT|nr:unnamed protein product [Chironomus riparius]